MSLTLGLGSGLCGFADDPSVIFAIADRGPNIKPARAELLDVDWVNRLDAYAWKHAKILIDEEIGPEIVELRAGDNSVEFVRRIKLIAPCGRTITGCAPLPRDSVAEYEPVFNINGVELPPDPFGADTEGIAVCRDGSFWIADEYVPSLLYASRDGVVRFRLIPEGMEQNFEHTSYEVQATLPAILARRKLNRGFEAICLSADESELIVALQSPLAHPDRAAHEASNLVRILVLDTASGQMKRQYAYPLDPPDSYLRDVEAEGAVARGDRKICEMLLLPPRANGETRLLLLERVSHTSRLYAVTLTPESALPDWVNDPGHRPALEQLHAPDARAAAGVQILQKTCFLDSDNHPELHADLEGMALLAPDQILLVNDNDFGTEGQITRFVRVSFDGAL